MNKRLITSLLVVITFALLGLVIYIGSLLKEEKTTIITIKKTKASSITYSKTVNLGTPAVGSPSPTEIILANDVAPSMITPTKSAIGGSQQNALTVTPDISVSPTSSFLATNISLTPTMTLTPTETTNYPTISKKTTWLPETGRTDYLATMLALASLIIFLSFLY